MKQTYRLITGALLTAAMVSAIPGSYAAFKKIRSGATRSMESAASIKASPVKFKAPEVSAPASAPETDGSLTLRGLVINTDTPYIVEFQAKKDLKVKNIHEFDEFYYEDFEPSGCAFMGDGRFYMASMYQPYIGAVNTWQKIYDATDWSLIDEREELPTSSSALSVAYDPSTCAAYGYFQNDDNDQSWFMYGRMNLATGEVLGLNNVDDRQRFLSIAASPDGYLYGVNCNGMFCRIDKSSGEITKLGHTDVKPQYMQSAIIDRETGVYYWAAMTDDGEAGLYKIDPVTYTAELISLFPQNQEIIGLHIVKPRDNAKAPASVEDASVAFERDNLHGTVSFKAPEVSVDGTPLSGSLKAHATLDGHQWETEVQPGSDCTLEISAQYNGLYDICVWVSSDDLSGAKTDIQKWIGPDVPMAVSGIKCDIDGRHVKLSWDAPSQGQHGGYVDPAEVVYWISTSGFDYPLVRDYTDTSYELDLPEGLTADIRFGIRPVYKESAGPYAYSETMTVGNPVFTVPCEISPYSDFKKFIVIDSDSDGDSWELGILQVVCTGGDDWILSPYVHLTAGQLYEMEYSASAKMGAMKPEILEVKAGCGDTPESVTVDIDSQEIRTIGLNKYNEYKASFSVDKDGDYRVGFHSAAGGQGLGLGAFSINTLADTNAPDVPTALMLTPAPLGELKATVSFTAPANEISGKPLASLAKAEIYRGEILVGTVDKPEPGQTYSIDDEKAQPGFNTYDVCVYGSDNVRGLAASVKGWVGLDIPRTPYDVDLKYEDNTLLMSWKMYETGVNGGYVDLDQVEYVVVEPTYMNIIAQTTGVYSIQLTVDDIPYQYSTALGVIAMNDAGSTNEASVSERVMIGPDLTLPFEERFGHPLDHSWNVVGESDDVVGWDPVMDLGPDGEPGLSYYYGEMYGDDQALVSQRISLRNVDKPTLRFRFKGRTDEDGVGGKFEVKVSESLTGGYEPVFVQEFDENSYWKWTDTAVDLSAYKGKSVFLSFAGVPDPEYGFGAMQILLDDISVRDDKDYDLEARNLSIDRDEVEVGVSEAKLTFSVRNHGLKAFADGGYSVCLFAGDRLFATVEGKEIDPEFGVAHFEAVYKPSVDDDETTLITAAISSDLDSTPYNDRTNIVKVFVVKPERPAVTDLNGSLNGGEVELAWTKPDLSGKPVREVTDDFESYRDFDVNRAGEWTIIDADRAEGCRVSYFFPGSDGPMGWTVMNPGKITDEIGERLAAYSGEKYMVAYNGFEDNDDWIITPELSGNRQEISFMARAESDEEGREMFEVYYSTTVPEIQAMTKLNEDDLRTIPGGWHEFRFSVPAGAKYFAVRCISHNRVAMHIDDFKYESAATPLKVKFIGYNVYRDGKKINDEPVTSESFIDTAADGKDHSYTVRVVYDRGESDHSNVAFVSTSAVGIVGMDIDASAQPVFDIQGRRIWTLTEGEVYVTKGRKFIYTPANR
ncbi:MAG: choice-of-anchor J domain-containing protein [Muribaculaceae bacterium]|nr:choice-of-anchor J domain-containing protein [Muribaculaceae bacterium]